eukprot:5821889-Lingulodinium_polyedra.AAC.1
MQLHHCATPYKRCDTTRSNRRFAVATARNPHARALHARARQKWHTHGIRDRAPKMAYAWNPRSLAAAATAK